MTERDIFLAAIDLPDPAARAAYLDRACAGNPELRETVEALIRADRDAGSFLGAPLVAPADMEFAATRDFTAPAPGPRAEEALAFLAPSARPDSLGRIGHYEVLQVLGNGAFGIVFRAFDDVLQRVVAVKVLAPQLAATSPARKRFLREARNSARVRHENVVQVYEVGEAPLPYLVMEFIPGETLQQRLDRIGPVEPAEVVRVGRQIAEGLAAAHAGDLIHRDIKPGNVLIEGGPQKVRITDFGLARAADDASTSQSGIIAGTPMYMAPEQATEQATGDHIDHRADLFSLGSVLYQMITGRPPFRASTTMAVLKRVCEDDPRPIREVVPEAPPWLCDVIGMLLAKNPDERFQTAREVADVLATCEDRLKASADPSGFTKVVPAARKPAPARRPGRKWVAVAALVVCALGVVAVALPQLLKDRARAVANPDAAPEPVPPVPVPAPVVNEPPAGVPPRVVAHRPGWSVLYPAEAKAENGTTLTARPGGAVLASGKLPDTDAYALTFAAPPARLAALRLEVLPHDALPNNGPSRHPHPGKTFVLTAVRAALSDPAAPGGWRAVKLTRAWADHSTGDDATPPLVLDADDNTGWGAEVGKPHFLVVAPDEPVAVPTGARLRVTLEFKHGDARRHLGHFRVSAATIRPLEPLAEAELKRIAGLAPREQIEAVREELKKRNPRFDGALAPTLDAESGAVAGLELSTEHVTDLSPIRALTKLRTLRANGPGAELGRLADLSPLAGLALTEMMVQHNRITDLTPLRELPLTHLWIDFNPVTDLTPLRELPLQILGINLLPVQSLEGLRGLKLERLSLCGVPVSDLSPLKGMPLRWLTLHATPVSDLSPLKGMPLEYLNLHRTKVRDLGPLEGLPLDQLFIPETEVTDLSPLKELPLVKLWCDFKADRDAPVLRGIKTLKKINSRPVAEVLNGDPAPPAGPFTDDDARRVAALPVAEQIEAVRAELKKRNPGFDGTLTPTVTGGAVTGLALGTASVSDIAPVRGLPALTALACTDESGKGRLTDLAPLKGLKLTSLNVSGNPVTDLAPLAGLSLTTFVCRTKGELDLAPLKGLPLTHLECGFSGVTDLSPLRGMKLARLVIDHSPVTDLSPLKGMPLTYLHCAGSDKVADLAPLKEMPLTHLFCADTKVTDLSPLKGMPLKEVSCPFRADRDAPVLRDIKTLETINFKPAAEFWKELPPE